MNRITPRLAIFAILFLVIAGTIAAPTDFVDNIIKTIGPRKGGAAAAGTAAVGVNGLSHSGLSPAQVGGIVGGIFGGVFLVAIVVLCLCR
ncbi:hypothetical protein QBC42DRAFT_289146 [Cladorrhinum samala]|uniref:Uncharacterized protein n=1 Tax=Cladorrhinum samala TaxID=585594 RepID=A0AAV9HJ26_9PEZI|nr:hypothetical protein QBC42DRAFT_289146 [Cladorrhinum samala]